MQTVDGSRACGRNERWLGLTCVQWSPFLLFWVQVGAGPVAPECYHLLTGSGIESDFHPGVIAVSFVKEGLKSAGTVQIAVPVKHCLVFVSHLMVHVCI